MEILLDTSDHEKPVIVFGSLLQISFKWKINKLYFYKRASLSSLQEAIVYWQYT